jgi:SAM-dependent methyltransferase
VVAAATGVRQVGDVSVDAGRGPGQLGWYEYAAGTFCKGKVVLDVGCGLGKGLDILASSAKLARGQDLDPRLARSDVTIGGLNQIPGKSVDVVTCIDVIEHVDDDAGFVDELARIARETIIITTPNWTLSRCQWPYHLREYTPRQLRELLRKVGPVTLLKGEPSGYENWPVNDVFYDLLNDARTWPTTAFATRCISRMLPPSLRLRAHLAAIVSLADA